MKAAILYSGKYGSTRQYAEWLGDSTGFPVYDIQKDEVRPGAYEMLVLGTSIIVGKPTLTAWLKAHWPELQDKKLLIFSVSGTAPGHPDLDIWMQKHLGDELASGMAYIALRGRLKLSQLPWWERWMLRLVGKVSKDPDVKQRMIHGFDFMDRAKLRPILEWVSDQMPQPAENSPASRRPKPGQADTKEKTGTARERNPAVLSHAAG